MLERIGRYEMLDRIATGGQGTVYRARDTVLDRLVAIKVINQSLADDPAYMESLQRESRLAGGLDHANITAVYYFQIEHGPPYIVMEYVPDSLDKHLRGQKPLDQDQAIKIATQVCRALEHAHANGVIHRDIKPNNVLLTEDGDVKVTDFGIARALASSTHSRSTSVVGAPQYMAPERWTGANTDGRADIYSLGVLLYELLTGSPPFHGDSVEAIFVQHREQPVPDLPRELRAVEAVVIHAMAKRPEQRFASASEMATALERVAASPNLASQLVTERPTRQRNYWDLVIGFAAVIAALIVAGIIIDVPGLIFPSDPEVSEFSIGARVLPGIGSTLVSEDGVVTISWEAGTTAERSEIRYRPPSPSEVPALPDGSFTLSTAFDLEIDNPLLKPFKVTVRVSEATAIQASRDATNIVILHHHGGA